MAEEIKPSFTQEDGLNQIKAVQERHKQEMLQLLRLNQAAAIDTQRALDADKKERDDAEQVKKLGSMDDATYLRWRRENCGF